MYNLKKNNKVNIQGSTSHKQNITGTSELSVTSSPYPSPISTVIHYPKLCINYSLTVLHTYTHLTIKWLYGTSLGVPGLP